MKKGLLLFGSMVMLSACNKLVENPSSLISQQQYYKTQADAVAAANAVYNTLNNAAGDFPMYGRQLNLLTDNTSDNQNFSPSNTNPDVRAMGTVTYVPANGRILKNWQQHYFGINRANLAIDNIPGIPKEKFTDQSIQVRTINEAKFLRGLLYFNLVRLFGDVPLILHNPTSVDISTLQVPRTSRDSVYRQVIADLQDATNLPGSYTGTDVGRATSGAAHALLAKVYITRHDWLHALTELQAVLNGGYGYGLFSNFKDVFQQGTKNGIEHIFSVQFQTNGGEANSVQYLSLSFSSFNTGTYPIDIISDSSVVKLFPAGDTRRAVTFFDRQYNPATGDTVYWNNPYAPYLNKFVDYSISPLTNQSLSGINFPVIRYAEVLLLYAEVLNEINGGPTAEGYSAINQVRQRAHIGNLVTGLNQHDFRDSLFVERRREFVQEGQRWFDLVRQGGHTLVDALHKIAAKSAASDKDTLFPIPLQEIQLNPLLSQNPGWENN